MGGVAKSLSEMEEVDRTWWASMTPEERLASIFDLWAEQSSLGENGEAPARLQRSLGGVRQRGR